MVNVTDKWTTNDILARLDCHRTTVLRTMEKLGIVPAQVGNIFLFSTEEADRIIEAIRSRKRKRSK
jgi:hypothetical protein